ncbi:hypothetical protein [Nocardioides sp. CER19]|uniref:hypothetical protein n=1 Tax=Nocardioides sp. CER19 TaxID=3038538 RepID=UPI00244AC89C|nr:hypothetical protein [Nocardioides sp. CER19]MDH2413963.1 hypothetical protein [Nocardioides sp. CER19]
MPRLSRPLPALLLAVVVTGAAVAAGVVLQSPPATHPTTTRPLATRLSSIDTTTAVVRRGPFCDHVPSADVHAAVDDDSPKAAAWSNGDPLPGTHDVAHEFGCSWTSGSGTVASAWVFAPPVTVARGEELVASARAQRGCTPLPGAAAFGSPTVALKCVAGATTTLSYRGLFGDAWLVCQLAGSRAPDPADVADRWCASVLQAAGT